MLRPGIPHIDNLISPRPPRATCLVAFVAAGTLMLHTLPACQARPARPDGARPVQRIASPAALPSAIADLQSHPVAFVQFPSISPDGGAVVFSYAGDLWVTSSSGGVAKRLTVHPADESRSAFSPCGTKIAFESDRDGPRNIYMMPLARIAEEPGAVPPLIGGAVRRITVSDRAQTLGTFSADGTNLYFASSHEPSIHRTTRLYRAPVDCPPGGGGPIERLCDAYGAAPSAAPDGNSLVFHRGRYDATRPRYEGSASGELFRFDLLTNAYTQLTSHPTNDGDGYTLPDGSIVFTSSRDGQNNLWILPPGRTDADGAARQITYFRPADGDATIAHGVRDLHLAPRGWHATFCVWDTLYTIDLSQAEPLPRPVPIVAGGDAASLDFARMNLSRQVSEAALSPDGKTIATIARGEVFIRSTEKDRPTRRLTDTHARERDLAWSPDNRVLYFASDISGSYGIYAATVVLSREDLTSEPLPDRAERPAEGKAEPEVPEPDPGTVPPAQPPEPGAPSDPPAPTTPPEPAAPAPAPQPDPAPGMESPWSIFDEFPGSALASLRQPAEPPSPPTPPADPSTPAAAPPAEPETPKESEPAKDEKKDEKKEDKKEDKKKIDNAKRWAESLTFNISPVLITGDDNRRPIFSPDGRRMLVIRNLGDLVLIELDHGDGTGVPAIASERVLFTSWTEPDPIWTADSRHIIYEINDLNFNSDIWLLDTGREGAAPINLTRHPDNDTAPRLSADGKVLIFLSDRDSDSNFSYDVYSVNLDRKLDGLQTYEMAEYLKEAADKAKKRKPLPMLTSTVEKAKTGKDAPPSPENPLAFDAEDAWRRIRKVTSIPTAVRNLEITPGGDRFIFTASIDGSTQLLSIEYDGRNRRTIHSGAASVQGLNLSGDKVLFVTGGQATTAPPAGGSSETLSIDAPVTIDIAQQQKQKFLEAARTMGSRFYHPTLKGLDWKRLTERYLDLAILTRTDSEFNRVFYHMLGELDGSHMGISGGRDASGSGQSIGYLGVDVEPAPGGYRITRIIPGGPADRRSSRLSAGESIIAINGVKLAEAPDSPPHTDFRTAMQGTTGQETLLEIARNTGTPDAPTRHMLITPYSFGADTNIRYEDEVARNREIVDRLSGGKLGYLHIRGMNMPAVRDFERDLYAAADGKLGLVIDVRDNGGGSTADILLSSLTAPRHAYTAARGIDVDLIPKDAYPRDRRLIYGYSRPINVLINQYSYSNAEIFAHAIKTINRGTLIGVPTFGAVISTGSFSLIDGTTVRMPFRGWYLLDGTDMENNGAAPDIFIPQTPADEAEQRDRQLEAAVQELIDRLIDPVTWTPLDGRADPNARR
jgi:tricorn protease